MSHNLGFTRKQIALILELFIDKYAKGETVEEVLENLNDGLYQFKRNM